MEEQQPLQKDNLLHYAFLWNEVRLAVAALSLIFGGTPVLMRFLGGLPWASQFLTLAWIISGLAALYVGYEWYKHDWKVFGTKDRTDLVAMGIAVISGLHLGIAGLSGTNIGMTVIPYGILTPIMLAAGLAYLFAAWHLYQNYQKHNNKLFTS